VQLIDQLRFDSRQLADHAVQEQRRLVEQRSGERTSLSTMLLA
jgi:hypothetical protein